MLILSRKKDEHIICYNSLTTEKITVTVKDVAINRFDRLSLSISSSSSSETFDFQIVPNGIIILFSDAHSIMRWFPTGSKHQVKLAFDCDKSIIVHRLEIWDKIDHDKIPLLNKGGDKRCSISSILN